MYFYMFALIISLAGHSHAIPINAVATISSRNQTQNYAIQRPLLREDGTEIIDVFQQTANLTGHFMCIDLASTRMRCLETDGVNKCCSNCRLISTFNYESLHECEEAAQDIGALLCQNKPGTSLRCTKRHHCGYVGEPYLLAKYGTRDQCCFANPYAHGCRASLCDIPGTGEQRCFGGDICYSPDYSEGIVNYPNYDTCLFNNPGIDGKAVLCTNGIDKQCFGGSYCLSTKYSQQVNNVTYMNMNACCYSNPLATNCKAVLCHAPGTTNYQCFGGEMCFSGEFSEVASSSYNAFSDCCNENPNAFGCQTSLCATIDWTAYKCVLGTPCYMEPFTNSAGTIVYQNGDACCFGNPHAEGCRTSLCVNSDFAKQCIGGSICFSSNFPTKFADFGSIDECCSQHPSAAGCQVTLCAKATDPEAYKCTGGSACPTNSDYTQQVGSCHYNSYDECCTSNPTAEGCSTASLCSTDTGCTLHKTCVSGDVCPDPYKNQLSNYTHFDTCCEDYPSAAGCPVSLCSSLDGSMSKCMDTKACDDLQFYPNYVATYQNYDTCIATNPSSVTVDDPALFWFRCVNENTCESICRSASSPSDSPCGEFGEIAEVTPTPFGNSYDACNRRLVDYPIGDGLYEDYQGTQLLPNDCNYWVSGEPAAEMYWQYYVCPTKKIQFSIEMVQMDADPCYDYIQFNEMPSSNMLFRITSPPPLYNKLVYTSSEPAGTLTFRYSHFYNGCGFTFTYQPV